MLLSVRTVSLAALAAGLLAYAAVPHVNRGILGPNAPIAADGSMMAGRARTRPADGAFPQASPTSDNPADFEPAIERERSYADFLRSRLQMLAGKLDVSLCKGSERQTMFFAVRDYYQTRGREKHNFSLRGPRAAAAIEREWSGAADRNIDNNVRHAVQYGFLHKHDFATVPEFTKTFADTQEFGEGCTVADDR